MSSPERLDRTVGEFVRRVAEGFGDRNAVVLGSSQLSYRELDQSSSCLARGLLAMNVGKGDRVGVLMADGPGWVRAWAAIGRIGAIAVTMSTFAKGDELARAIRHPDVVGIIFDSEVAGEDMCARLERALPDLSEQRSPCLRLGSVPYLRWLAAAGNEAPAWAVSTAWIDGQSWVDLPVDDELLAAVEREVRPDDPAMMIYTSGSTAEPKGVVHSHRTVFDKTSIVARGMCFSGVERSYSPMPFFWVGGLINNLLPTLVGGGTVYCLARFDAGELLQLVHSERLTRIQAWPQHAAALAEHPALERCDTSSLRWGPAALMTRPLPTPPGGLFASLGMTETFGPYGWGRPDGAVSAAMVSVPIDELEAGYELRLVDEAGETVVDGAEGEIIVRGPTLTPALYKRDHAEVFDADGFYRTGDLGIRREGRVFFAGRKGSLIKRGGASVAPKEVEELLLGADGVAEAYVVGIPDEVRGQLIAAAVVPRAGAHLEPYALRQWAKERISTFKVPDFIVVLERDEIPRTPSQKVRTDALAWGLSQRMADEVEER